MTGNERDAGTRRSECFMLAELDGVRGEAHHKRLMKYRPYREEFGTLESIGDPVVGIKCLVQGK